MTAPSFIELVCKDGGSILVPRLKNRIPANYYIPVRESEITPDGKFIVRQRIIRFVRCGNSRVYQEQ